MNWFLRVWSIRGGEQTAPTRRQWGATLKDLFRRGCGQSSADGVCMSVPNHSLVFSGVVDSSCRCAGVSVGPIEGGGQEYPAESGSASSGARVGTHYWVGRVVGLEGSY